VIKIWIIFVIIFSLTLFSYSESLAFAESDRAIIYPKGITENCYPTIQPRSPLNPLESSPFMGFECETDFNEKFLKSSYFSVDGYALYEFEYREGSFIGEYENFEGHTTGAINFTIPVDERFRPNFFEEIKISKAEFRLLAIPLSKSDGNWTDYSGKFISSLFTCSGFAYFPDQNRGACVIKEELDSIIVDTKELPKFLVFDITGIVDKTRNSEETQFTILLESKPIEQITGKNLKNFSDLVNKIKYEQLEHDYGSTNYQSYGNDPLIEFKLVETENIPEIFINSIDQKINHFYHIRPIDSELVTGSGFAIFFGSADFFMTPSGTDNSVSRSLVIIDYEKLDSEFSKAFTYFLVLVLPTIAIIIPAIFWIMKKKKTQIPTNQLPL